MIFYIIILLFLLFLTWVLFAPFWVKIHTEESRYEVGLPGVFALQVIPNTELFHLRVWIFFIPIKIDPFRRRRTRKRRPDPKKEEIRRAKKAAARKKRKKRFNLSRDTQKIKRMSRAVKIRRLEMNLDTDDVITNSWLISAFSLMNQYENINLRINYEGVVSLDLDARTRAASLLWIYITTRKQ